MGLEWGKHAHLTLEKKIALRKGMPGVGITVQQCYEQISLGSQNTKCRNVLQWKLQRPRSCCDSDSSAPSCICPHLPEQDSKIRTPVLFLALQFIHSCNRFSLSTHCIPSTALGESIKQTRIKWNTIRLGHGS